MLKSSIVYIQKNPSKLLDTLISYIKEARRKLIIVVAPELPINTLEENVREQLKVEEYSKFKLIPYPQIADFILRTYAFMETANFKKLDNLLFYEYLSGLKNSVKPQLLDMIKELRNAGITPELLDEHFPNNHKIPFLLKYYKLYLELLHKYSIYDDIAFIEKAVDFLENSNEISAKHHYLFFGFKTFNSYFSFLLSSLKRHFSVSLLVPDIGYKTLDPAKIFSTSVFDFLGFEKKYIEEDHQNTTPLYFLNSNDLVYYLRKEKITKLISNANTLEILGLAKLQDLEFNKITQIQLKKAPLFNLLLTFLDKNLLKNRVKQLAYYLGLEKTAIATIDKMSSHFFNSIDEWIFNLDRQNNNTYTSLIELLKKSKSIKESENLQYYIEQAQSFIDILKAKYQDNFYPLEQILAIEHLLKRYIKLANTLNLKKTKIKLKLFIENIRFYSQEIYLNDKENIGTTNTIYSLNDIALISPDTVLVLEEENKKLPPESPFLDNFEIFSLREFNFNLLTNFEKEKLDDYILNSLKNTLRTLIIPMTNKNNTENYSLDSIYPRRVKIEAMSIPKTRYSGNLSYTSITKYTECPYKFFLQYIIGITAPEDSDSLAFTPIVRGTLFHKILQELMSSDYLSFMIPEDKLKTKLDKLLEQEIEKLVNENTLVQNKFLDFDKSIVHGILTSFTSWYFNDIIREQNLENAKRETETSILFDYPNITNKIKAKIDIYFQKENKLYIYDYKTSDRVNIEQLYFYLLALLSKLQKDTKVEAQIGFLSITYKKILKKEQIEGQVEEIEKVLYSKLDEKKNMMSSFITNFKNNKFNMTTEQKQCKDCDFRSICDAYKID